MCPDKFRDCRSLFLFRARIHLPNHVLQLVLVLLHHELRYQLAAVVGELGEKRTHEGGEVLLVYDDHVLLFAYFHLSEVSDSFRTKSHEVFFRRLVFRKF